MLGLHKKMEITTRLWEGESASSIASIYGIGRTTVNDIKRDTDSCVQMFLVVKTFRQGKSVIGWKWTKWMLVWNLRWRWTCAKCDCCGLWNWRSCHLRSNKYNQPQWSWNYADEVKWVVRDARRSRHYASITFT